MSSRIYIIAHKPVEYGIWKDNLYQPIQVGYNERFLDIRDSDGDNPYSQWNQYYAENTASWWIAHNETAEYVGQCQYRRRFKFKNEKEVEDIFKNYDIVCCKPLEMSISLYEQYSMCHSYNDIPQVTEVLTELYPDYLEDWNRVLRGKKIYYSNSYVMKNNDYKNYVHWLYTIGEKLKIKNNWTTIEELEKDIQQQIVQEKRNKVRGLNYQRQVMGFLSERLFTLYVTHNYAPERIYHKEYTKFENLAI